MPALGENMRVQREVKIEVAFSSDVGKDEQQIFSDRLKSVGVMVNEPPPAVRQIEWLVLAILPLHALLSKGGEDAYEALKSAVKDLFERRRNLSQEPSSVILEDEHRDITITLEPGLPEEAYQQLRSIDPAMYADGSNLHYERDQNRWQ
ncbi:hypothetical protein ACFWSF_37755 [Streptomyces sp. NPDC058611]|uniref:hypothetical protein n=1 Tax=unclassified Streptomyces TaxID=2593676 RepID=UPI003662E04A